ncbi:hypothetical protein CP8484711_0114, partial [Chlamydia psittaci 84-8471/1]
DKISCRQLMALRSVLQVKTALSMNIQFIIRKHNKLFLL